MKVVENIAGHMNLETGEWDIRPMPGSVRGPVWAQLEREHPQVFLRIRPREELALLAPPMIRRPNVAGDEGWFDSQILHLEQSGYKALPLVHMRSVKRTPWGVEQVNQTMTIRDTPTQVPFGIAVSFLDRYNPLLEEVDPGEDMSDATISDLEAQLAAAKAAKKEASGRKSPKKRT